MAKMMIISQKDLFDLSHLLKLIGGCFYQVDV